MKAGERVKRGSWGITITTVEVGGFYADERLLHPGEKGARDQRLSRQRPHWNVKGYRGLTPSKKDPLQLNLETSASC